MSSIILPGQGIDKRKGKKEALEIDPAAPKALTVFQTLDVLKSMAASCGRIYGVKLSVGMQGADFFFVDDVGERVVDRAGNRPEEECLACSYGEIEDGMFLKLFFGRAMYAAAAEKMNMLSRGEK